VLGADAAGATRLRPALAGRLLGYGIVGDARLRASELDLDRAGTTFTVHLDDATLGSVRLPVPGRHNVLNALAAIGVGLELGLGFATIAEAMGGFVGVGRRFEARGERDGVTVVDDYAHHPTEVAAALEAGRQAFPGRRLVAVFQPHLYSRTRAFAEGFARALLAADVVVILPIYPAREAPIDGVDSGLLVDAARRLGHASVEAAPDAAAALAMLSDRLRPGDVLLTLGAGDVDRIAAGYLEGAA
jgi:UDP-N-acetylmuramate--alanine ligase